MLNSNQLQLPAELAQSDPVQYHRDCAAVTRASQLRDGVVAPTPEYGLQPTPRPRDTAPDNTVVFVGGLQDNIPEILLRAVFSPFGTIDYVKKNATSFGFIKFVQRDAAELAIEKLQGMRLRGVHLRLGWGKDQAPRQPQQPLEELVLPYIHPCGATAIQNAIQACGGLCSFAKVINALACQEQEGMEYPVQGMYGEPLARQGNGIPDSRSNLPPVPSAPESRQSQPQTQQPPQQQQQPSQHARQNGANVISPFSGWYTEPTRLPSLSSSVESDASFTVKSPSQVDSNGFAQARRTSDESAGSSPPISDTAQIWYSTPSSSNACDSSCSCDAGLASNTPFDLKPLGSRGAFGPIGGPTGPKGPDQRWAMTPSQVQRDYTVNWVNKVSPIAQRKERLW